jgi:hypothetical protein
MAQALAHDDLPSCLTWLDKIGNQRSYAQSVADTALELAASRPEQAERVWKLVNGRIPAGSDAFSARDCRTAEVCFKIAGQDAKRAQAVAETVDAPFFRARGLGAVAMALSNSDPAAARRLLLEAADIVAQAKTSSEHLSRSETPASAMAWLLPVAERIDAELGRELLWRAVALRQPRPETQWLDDEVLMAEVHLSGMLARYEPRLAREILEPVTMQLAAFCGPPEGNQKAMFTIAAATLVDPRWAVELMERLPEPADVANFRPKNASRKRLARVLGCQGKSRWEYAGFWEPKE